MASTLHLLPSLLLLLLLHHGCRPAVNLLEMSYQPSQSQYFLERPQNETVIEGESVLLKCKIGNLAGKVQWSTDGFAMGYDLETIRNYCDKCSPRGDISKGEFHLFVENVTLGKFNEFECQVSPGHDNLQHSQLRARAKLNVLVPPSHLELVNTKPVLTLNAGSVRAMSCRARNARPQAKIVWYMGDNKILDQEYATEVSNGVKKNGEDTWDTTNTLKFRATARDDGRRIRCVVEHRALRRANTMEKTIDLSVYYPPGEPQILGDISGSISQGDMINVTCLSKGGNPQPKVAWFRDQKEITNPWRDERHSGMARLYIRAEQSHLNSVFSCQAWNTITPNRLRSRDIKFNVTFSGDRVHISGPDRAQIGSNVSLVCSSEESNPASLIRWRVEGEEKLGSQEVIPVTKGGWKTTSVLLFNVNVNLSQMKVTCSAYNDLYNNVIQETKTVTILRPPEAPSISGLPEISLREDDELVLTCRSRPDSAPPTLQWFRQGQHLENQNVSVVAVDSSVSEAKLYLKVSRRDNNVEYSCQASNGNHFPSVSQKTNFSVYFEPRTARLYLTKLTTGLDGREKLYSHVGERLQLNCQAGNSNPPPKFAWYKNGQLVTGGETVVKPGKHGGYIVTQTYQVNGGNPVTFQANNTSYKCVVTNPAINGKNVAQEYVLDVRYAPEFHSSQGNFTVIEGNDISISIKASGNPAITKFTWKAQKTDLLPANFITRDSQMEVKKISRGDAGLYFLQARNSLGEKTLQVSLNVNYHPKILSLTPEVIVDQDEMAVFVCVVDASPISENTVTWGTSDKNRESHFLEKAQFEYDGKMTFTMTIPRVGKSERGEYFCLADNGLAPGHTHKKTSELKVNFKPEIRKFPRYSKFAIRPMHHVDLSCVAYGYPDVKIFWKKAGEVLPTERYIVNNKGITKKVGYSTWESTLTIESAFNTDYTDYQCYATNELGEDTFNISLTKRSRPEAPVNLEVIMKDYRTVQLRWEPGFNGGFDQHFETRIKDVSTGSVTTETSRPTTLDPNTRWVYQNIKVDPDSKYSFAVRASNVQGESRFSVEKIKELKASENKAKNKDSVPRVIIVAIVLGSILFVIIKLMIITCCIKQRKENKRREEKKLERSSSLSSKRSIMMDGGYQDMFISPASQCGSNISVCHEPQDYKYLGRSLSTGHESDKGYNSYNTGTCSVHGTLNRHFSSGIDTTVEEDVFDDYSRSLSGDIKTNGGLAFPFQTADMMLKGGKMRSRAGSLSSPTGPPPRLGVSGLYTDHLERRNYKMDPPGLSPPMIPSPPPPVSTSTLSRKHQFPPPEFLPPPPPPAGQCNGKISFIEDKKSQIESSNDLTRRIAELGLSGSVEPVDSMGHLQIRDLPDLSAYTSRESKKQSSGRSGNSSHFM